jgi:ribosomal-protein-serine acetyltransferase
MIDLQVTPQLRVKSISPENASALAKLVTSNSEHLRVYLPKVVEVITSEDTARAHIEHAQQLERSRELVETHLFYEGQLCGAIRFNNFEHENKKASIAYFLGTEYQGQGIVTKAATAMLDYGFKTLELNRIELRCVTTNKASIAVAERLGFTREGELREAELLAQGFVNHYLYSLLHREYKSVNSTNFS